MAPVPSVNAVRSALKRPPFSDDYQALLGKQHEVYCVVFRKPRVHIIAEPVFDRRQPGRFVEPLLKRLEVKPASIQQVSPSGALYVEVLVDPAVLSPEGPDELFDVRLVRLGISVLSEYLWYGIGGELRVVVRYRDLVRIFDDEGSRGRRLPAPRRRRSIGSGRHS